MWIAFNNTPNVIGMLAAIYNASSTKKAANKPITFVMNQLLVKGNIDTGYHTEYCEVYSYILNLRKWYNSAA